MIQFSFILYVFLKMFFNFLLLFSNFFQHSFLKHETTFYRLIKVLFQCLHSLYRKQSESRQFFGVCPVARKFISPKAQRFEGALVRKLTCPKVLVFIFYFADIIIYWWHSTRFTERQCLLQWITSMFLNEFESLWIFSSDTFEVKKDKRNVFNFCLGSSVLVVFIKT